ncbi:hypothetical protein HYU22_04985 [Candidatus Woesearchaeota archaeon]|nr:hypothetical protein [Candidatus Woesearchaeota archaeon]
MQQLAILNTRDIKKIKEIVTADFGYFPEEDYAFIQNENDKLYLVSKDIAKLNLQNLIIDKVGLYFAEVKNTQVRLSKEGAQLLAEAARNKKIKLQNVVELTAEETKAYFQGEDLPKELGAENRLILLSYHKNILGCAKYKEQKILNFLPKIHRGEVIL